MKNNTKSNKFVTIVNGRAFQTNDLGMKIVKLTNLGYESEDIVNKLKEDGFSVDTKKVIEIQEHLKNLTKTKSSHIKTIYSIKISKILFFVKLLSKLFNYVILILVLIGNLYLMYYCEIFTKYHFNDYITVIIDNPYLFLLYAIINIVILFFHELGHTAASYRYNVQPKNIGIGLYLFYLVFYTDVTKSWILKRQHRLLIDFGGLYFQLIISLLLLFCVISFNGIISVFCGLLFWDNAIIFLININPFVKFDGYWILCDIFDVKNLQEKSHSSIAELILFSTGKCKKLTGNFLLYLYSIVSTSFFVYLYIIMIHKLFSTINVLKNIIINTAIFSQNMAVNTLKLIFLIIAWWYFSKMLFNHYKSIKKYVYIIQKKIGKN